MGITEALGDSTKRTSLTWRQAMRVMLAALAVGFFTYMIEIVLFVDAVRTQNRAVHEQMLDLVEQPSRTAVWHFEEQSVSQALSALLRVEQVLKAKVTLNNGDVFAQVERKSNIQLTQLESVLVTLFKDLQYGSRPILGPKRAKSLYGSDEIALLSLEFDIGLITRLFKQQMQVLFWGNVLRSFVLALVLGLIFHRFLTRPIVDIGTQLKDIEPGATNFAQLQIPKGHKVGELYYLVQRFNDMLNSTTTYQKHLRKLATRDHLTNLPNRALIYEELAAQIRRAKESEQSFAFFFVDLDRFKNVNDSMGHAVGDQMLCLIAEALKSQLPSYARLGRLGGDEFVVISEHSETRGKAVDLAETIIRLVSQPINLNGLKIEPACSIGIAMYPEHGADVEEIVKNADIAMYSVKGKGVNNYALFKKEMHESSEAKFKIELDLAQAIEGDELELYFQPKISSPEEKTIGCEALLRWTKDNKLLSPAEFIPIAEETQMIVPIGYWVIEEACKTLTEWLSNDINLSIAVNVSPIQLEDAKFILQVSEILTRYPRCKDYLEFEITESCLMSNLEKTLSLFVALKRLGISISIDDFGTGYSCLSYLRRMDIDTLKIDRSFVMNLPKDVAIPVSILALANQLGLKTVAEGVETKEQKDWLIENGCDVVQGFYYSKPLPREEFEKKYLVEHSKSYLESKYQST